MADPTNENKDPVNGMEAGVTEVLAERSALDPTFPEASAEVPKVPAKLPEVPAKLPEVSAEHATSPLSSTNPIQVSPTETFASPVPFASPSITVPELPKITPIENPDLITTGHDDTSSEIHEEDLSDWGDDEDEDLGLRQDPDGNVAKNSPTPFNIPSPLDGDKRPEDENSPAANSSLDAMRKQYEEALRKKEEEEAARKKNDEHVTIDIAGGNQHTPRPSDTYEKKFEELPNGDVKHRALDKVVLRKNENKMELMELDAVVLRDLMHSLVEQGKTKIKIDGGTPEQKDKVAIAAMLAGLEVDGHTLSPAAENTLKRTKKKMMKSDHPEFSDLVGHPEFNDLIERTNARLEKIAIQHYKNPKERLEQQDQALDNAKEKINRMAGEQESISDTASISSSQASHKKYVQEWENSLTSPLSDVATTISDDEDIDSKHGADIDDKVTSQESTRVAELIESTDPEDLIKCVGNMPDEDYNRIIRDIAEKFTEATKISFAPWNEKVTPPSSLEANTKLNITPIDNDHLLILDNFAGGKSPKLPKFLVMTNVQAKKLGYDPVKNTFHTTEASLDMPPPSPTKTHGMGR